jgi:hypothetical protein
VSQVPAEIAGIGSTQQKLRASPAFDPLKSAVGPDEYFIFSRIDGTQSLRDVLFASGLPMDRAVAAAKKLRELGAVLLPNEATPAVPKSAQKAAPPAIVVPPKPAKPGPMSASESVVLNHDLTLPGITKEEQAALAESVDMNEAERRLILAMARLVNEPWALLGVANNSDAKTLKRAYFTLSKSIHPDRFFGKKLGSFRQRTADVFEAMSRAYARLTDTRAASGTGGYASLEAQQQPQTPQEYAAELFDRACQLEVSGDALEAMKLFAAAVRVDPQVRYLRRAASCALAAKQPKSAVEYAKKAHTAAPNDPSSARLLAASFRAAGKLADAEEVLIMAMALKSENDVLTAELRNDLAEVRRLLARA